MMTKIEKLMKRLATGKNLTVSEATKRYGVQNLSARVSELRDAGFTIYTNQIRDSKTGRKVTAYRMAE